MSPIAEAAARKRLIWAPEAAAIAAAIRRTRKQLGLTQAQAAARCGEAHQTWQKWETARIHLTAINLLRACDALECSLERLTGEARRILARRRGKGSKP